jgi:hypothetical protein
LRLLAFAVSVLSGYYPQKDHYCNANGVMAFFGCPHEHIAAIAFAITLIIWSDGGAVRRYILKSLVSFVFGLAASHGV